MTEVAIVGMAAVYPAAPDLDTYWRNLEGGVDAISDVPAHRWDPVFFDPAASAADRFYCRRGGFVDDGAVFDPVAFGVMPIAAAGAEPDQLLALHVAGRALADAGYGKGRALAGDRAGVILGRGGYLTPGMARLSQRVRTPQQLVTTLAELVPGLDAATLERVRVAFAASAGDLGPEAAFGLVPNLAASRLASRLDLRGPAYTVDAACASSLLAVDQGCRELADQRCDVVIAGGVHVCHDVTFWSVFTQLGALSRAGAIRPFDRRADGILIGEGAGLLVLKRLADAERDGDRIYAVIRGTGVTSDGRDASPMKPRLEGQLAVLAQAWRAAGRDPAAVGMLEAHGTGTPAGDEVELDALGRFFGSAAPGEARANLGSVKSMIGHAMPAAGAAGLIKTALALFHGVQPPTLHCEEPRAELAQTRFRTLATAEPWGERPRLAGVSAFGFGGINAHVVVEAHASAGGAGRRRGGPPVAAALGVNRPVVAPAPVLLLAARSSEELRAALATAAAGDPATGTGPVRLALFDPTPERRALARTVIDRGRPWRGNRDLWFSPAGLAAEGGRIAFLFPGIEVGFAPQIADVARHFDLPLAPALEAAVVTDGTSRALERQGLGVFALGRLLFTVLARMGVHPDVMAGHSIGEWTAMVASEMVPPGTIDTFLAGLPAGSLEVPDVVFAAVGCGVEGAHAGIEGLDEIAVSHDNCPHQSILCGRRESIRVALARLAARGVLCQQLPFRSGFHSPLLAEHLEPHRRHLGALGLQHGRVPLWSATTCAPYPEAPAEIRALAVAHLVRPVRFRELIERLHDDGVRAFVQLGVGSLVNFVGDTLRGRDHVAIAASSAKDAGVLQLTRVAAALFVEGFDARAATAPAPVAVARSTQRLALGAPLVRLGASIGPLTLPGAPPAFALPPGIAPSIPSGLAASHPVVAELLATLHEAASAGQAVVDAWARAAAAPPAFPRELILRRALSIEAEPALLDHCFYRQPAGWPTVSDRYPVVPMTMIIGMMIDAARTLVPARVAIALEDVRAYRWLAVAPAVTVELRCRADGDDRVEIEIPGYARATVRLAATYPSAPAPTLGPLTAPRPSPVTAVELYRDRWMFHGPAYQGVVAVGPVGDDGVDGAIEALPAPGALLDCAGQLMGWWVMQREPLDRLAMPVRIAQIALFGAEPTAGRRLDCAVRIRDVRAREVHADLELSAGGQVWARITDWEDRRFDSDDPVWAILMYPERNALGVAHPDGPVVVTEHWQAAASRELMMRRYLGERERAEFEQLDPRRRRGWLLGRIAIKDAVRQYLWARGAGPLFPAEIGVANLASGRPVITGPGTGELVVSLAHKDDVAVALVAPAGGRCGIDVERIAARPDSFAAVAFTEAELALGADRPRDEWMARLWTAKEALAKARAPLTGPGTGTVLGAPRRLEIQRAAGDLLIVDGEPVHTRRDGDLVIAWTPGPPPTTVTDVAKDSR